LLSTIAPLLYIFFRNSLSPLIADHSSEAESVPNATKIATPAIAIVVRFIRNAGNRPNANPR